MNLCYKLIVVLSQRPADFCNLEGRLPQGVVTTIDSVEAATMQVQSQGHSVFSQVTNYDPVAAASTAPV